VRSHWHFQSALQLELLVNPVSSARRNGAHGIVSLPWVTLMVAGVVYNDRNRDGKRQVVVGGKGTEGGIPNVKISMCVTTHLRLSGWSRTHAQTSSRTATCAPSCAFTLHATSCGSPSRQLGAHRQERAAQSHWAASRLGLHQRAGHLLHSGVSYASGVLDPSGCRPQFQHPHDVCKGRKGPLLGSVTVESGPRRCEGWWLGC
jgi:hypothetical protein